MTVFTEGGDYQPIVTTIDWAHDWSSGAGIRVNSDSQTTQYWRAVRITDDGTNSYIEVNFATTINDVHLLLDNYGWRLATLYTGTLPAGGGTVRASANVARFGIEDKFIIRHNGNVGIGTASPQAKLAVNGAVLATEVKVKTDIAVPDYVFAPDYEVATLAEVEAYVKEHRHLPEIPSAADVEKDGLDLAKMNLLLLKKVEELTLHLIEKDKQLDDVHTRLNRLEEQNKSTDNQ